MTARLTTGKTITRAIIRDLAGRFCWDSAVLYGPPRCRTGSYPAGTHHSSTQHLLALHWYCNCNTSSRNGIDVLSLKVIGIGENVIDVLITFQLHHLTFQPK